MSVTMEVLTESENMLSMTGLEGKLLAMHISGPTV
jgi:hypothetical protein